MPTCPECGTPVQPDWDWCHQCGFDPAGKLPAEVVSHSSAAGNRVVASVAPNSPEGHPGELPAPVRVRPFDLRINAVGSRAELVYDGTTFRSGKKLLVVEEISWVSWLTIVVNGVASAHNFKFSDNTTTIKLTAERGTDAAGAKYSQADVASLLRGFIHNNVEPRLVDSAAAAIRAGHPVTVGKMMLGKTGFEGPSALLGRTKGFRWDALRDVTFRQGKVVVTVEDHGKTSKAIAVEMKEPNAVLLPAMLWRLRSELS